MKAYTDLEQSKKLAEILPPESADMYYLAKPDDTNSNMVVSDICIPRKSENDGQAFGELYAWSLAALLSVLPDGTDIIKDKADTENEKYMCTVGIKDDIISTFADNPIDACVAMIEKLHELNLL